MDTLIALAVAAVITAFFVRGYLKGLKDRDARAREAAEKGKLFSEGPRSQHPHIDTAQCIGCATCTTVCPEGDVLAMLAGKASIVNGYKCIGHGLCAEACPVGATLNGDRDTLIAEAKQRIAAKPDQYYGKIYGLNEVGGTSVLLLSSVPFEEFGYRADLTRDPLPMYTYRVLSRIPDFVPLGGMVLGGIWWITHRREEVAAAEEGHGPEAVRKGSEK